MANLYQKYILPKITHTLCASGPAMKQRQKVVPLATGVVLEIGVGSGLNFKYYNTQTIEHLFALDPSNEMWSLARKQLTSNQINVEFIKGYAEEIPLSDQSIDSIVITFTLCTIRDVDSALSEMRRVLKPTGKLIFCEHGTAPDAPVRRWQNRLNPVWRQLGGGCNLNRNIPQILEHGGFHLSRLETMYIPGFKPACFNYWGEAIPKISG
jgi:ubiquinone/menaquinone biosynthesis C-methylase UbiE